MEQLFSNSQVIDMESLKLQRKSNPAAVRNESTSQQDDLFAKSIPNNPIPDRVGTIQNILPSSYLKMYSATSGQENTTAPVPTARDFEGHSYHSESSLPPKEDSKSSEESNISWLLLLIESVNKVSSTSSEYHEFGIFSKFLPL